MEKMIVTTSGGDVDVVIQQMLNMSLCATVKESKLRKKKDKKDVGIK